MEQEGKMKSAMISGSELSTRATLIKKGVLPKHFETVTQYKIRLEHLPNETNPIQYIKSSMPITQSLDAKGCFVI